MGVPEGESFLLETHDGAPVVVHHWKPEGSVRGVVNLVHGLAEHAARYAHVAAALGDAGFEVYAADLRGHGQTARSDEELGFFAEERGWARVLDDLHRLTVRARADHPDVPAFILGHSMGSFLTQQYLFTFVSDVDGAALSGSNGPVGPLGEAGAIVARVERLRLGPRGRSPLLNQLVFGAYNRAFQPARTDFDWISRDEEQVDRYLDDPRCGFVATTQLYLDLFSGLRVIQQVDRVAAIRSDLPIYLFGGTDDPVGGERGITALAELYAEAGLTDVEVRLYPEGRHEMLNDVVRDQVIADLVGWFDRQVTRLSGDR